jgi:integrase/recombinase XerD
MKNKVVRRNYEEDVITIFDAFQQFLEDKQSHNLSKSSLIDYEDSFRYFMNYFEFNEYTPLSVVDSNMFKKWTIDLLERDIKPTSINRYLRDCKVFFNWCINNALLHLPELQIDMVKGQEEAIKSFSDADVTLILQKPLSKNDFVEWRTWTVVNWILATGNRAGTVVEIRIGDIDFKNREITLRHTKNKKAQIVPLSSKLATIIKEYLHTWRYGCGLEDFLFPNQSNEQLTADALTQSFAKYCKKRGCSKTSIHGLRHTFALNWIRNGGNQFKLQKILGHSTLDMTRRYVALAAIDLKEDFDSYCTLDSMSKSCKPKKTIIRI